MRVLFIGHQAALGGAQNILHSVMLGLSQSEIDPIAIFPEDGPSAERTQAAGIRTIISPLKCWQYIRASEDEPRGIGHYFETFEERIEKLCTIIRDTKPDVVYINSAVIIEPVIAATICGVPKIWHIHELFECDPSIKASGFASLVFPLMSLPGTRIIAVSQAVAQELSKKVPNAIVDVALNGISTDISSADISVKTKLSCFGGDASNPVVLFAGEFSHRKGIDILFEAISIVLASHPSARFCFAGNDSRDALQKQISKLPERYRNSIKPLGFCDDMQLLYENADMLVLPSRGDPFPTVVLEAMAASLAVIGTRSGGMEEQILDGKTGLLVPVDDSMELAGAIMELLADKGKRKAMGVAGQVRVATEFTMGKMVDAVAASLKKAAESTIPDTDETAPLLEAISGFIGQREKEHNRQLEDTRKRLKKVEEEFKQFLNMPPIRFLRWLRSLIPGKRHRKPTTLNMAYAILCKPRSGNG